MLVALLLGVSSLASAQFVAPKSGNPLFTCAGLEFAWCALRNYSGTTDQFPGAFLTFQMQNRAGTWLDAVLLNGGLVDPTAGHEQGDLDIGFQVDGKYVVIAFTGSYMGQEPGIQASPPDLLWLGSSINRFAGLNLTEVACPPSAPAKTCVRVGDGYVPVYR
jgi:hypothetical protein